MSLYRYDDDQCGHCGGQRTRLGGRSAQTSLQVRGKARALYTFRAQTGRELSFRKGDHVYLLRQVDRNWFYGERHGLRGIFPVTYVEVSFRYKMF